MKIKAKNGETMFWVVKHRKMVRFVNGIADVDDQIGKEMLASGYKQEGVATVSSPKRVVEPNTTQPKFKV